MDIQTNSIQEQRTKRSQELQNSTENISSQTHSAPLILTFSTVVKTRNFGPIFIQFTFQSSNSCWSYILCNMFAMHNAGRKSQLHCKYYQNNAIYTISTTSMIYATSTILQSTGWPGCLVLKQGAVNQLFLGVFLMFLACLDHARWAEFHLGILGPQEWKKSLEILSWKKVRFQDLLKLTFFWFPIFLVICP